MKKCLSYNFQIWKNAYLKSFLYILTSLWNWTNLYDKPFMYIWKIYDKHFWSTRVLYHSRNDSDEAGAVFISWRRSVTLNSGGWRASSSRRSNPWWRKSASPLLCYLIGLRKVILIYYVIIIFIMLVPVNDYDHRSKSFSSIELSFNVFLVQT